LKFGVKDNYLVLMSICMLCENRCSETPASLTRINKVSRTFFWIFLRIGVKLAQVSSDFDLVKNLYSASFMLLGGVNVFIPIYSTLIVCFWWNSFL